MKVNVFHDGICIGQAKLDRLDPPMCVAGGLFEPIDTYENLGNLLQRHMKMSVSPTDFSSDEIEAVENKVLQLTYALKCESGDPIGLAEWGAYIEDASFELGPDGRMLWAAFGDAAEYSAYFADLLSSDR